MAVKQSLAVEELKSVLEGINIPVTTARDSWQDMVTHIRTYLEKKSLRKGSWSGDCLSHWVGSTNPEGSSGCSLQDVEHKVKTCLTSSPQQNSTTSHILSQLDFLFHH